MAKYHEPVYEHYYAFFAASASAVTAFNVLKEKGIIKCNGTSQIKLDETSFDRLIKTLNKISIEPEEGIKILTAQYEKLRTSNETDKAFLRVIECFR